MKDEIKKQFRGLHLRRTRRIDSSFIPGDLRPSSLCSAFAMVEAMLASVIMSVIVAGAA